jgi:hypothetical protein
MSPALGWCRAAPWRARARSGEELSGAFPGGSVFGWIWSAPVSLSLAAPAHGGPVQTISVVAVWTRRAAAGLTLGRGPKDLWQGLA